MNGSNAEIGPIITTLTRVLVAPSSNIKVAILLYATIGVFLLLVLVVGVMFILSAPEDEDETVETDKKGPSAAPGPVRAVKTPATPRARAASLAIALVVVACAWVAAGYSTSDSGLCKGCHWATSAHAKADAASDPHAKVACVECHEGGGRVGRYVTGLPSRALHLVLSSNGGKADTGYGRVSTRACASCHTDSLAGTRVSSKRGLKVLHSQALASSARCIDCHTRSNGIVSAHNAGMKPCLRCHDGTKVSTKCETCHQKGKTTAAARVRTATFQAHQIQDISCSGCHDEAKECDPCHATRMPHTEEFKNGAHSRAGAVDLWYDGGKACGKCHTATRRPCTRCHTSLLGRAHGPSFSYGHRLARSDKCNTCHLEYAYIATRDFCKDLCHTAAAKAASPR